MPIVDIILPKLGESVAEATIIKWLKTVGDKIERDENLAEVATDKVDTDLPSEYEGVLRSILVEGGEIVKVGAPIATIEVATTAVSSIKTSSDAKVTTVDSVSASHQSQRGKAATNKREGVAESKLENKTGLFLTPVVRNIASEAGLTAEDLLKIKPTGSNASRITKKDILNYLKPSVTQVGTINDPIRDLPIEEGDEVVQLSRMRKLIAEHMSKSVHTAAHVTSWVLADVTDAVAMRESSKAAFYNEHGVKLTYTHLFIKCVIETLLEYPKLNAWLNGGQELIVKKHINLGFATATPDDNLIVPNLKSAEDLDIAGISIEVNRLGAAAKSSKLKAADIASTTFTVSNTGIYGSLMGTPILSLPQVGVLALGEIVTNPAVIEVDGVQTITIRKQMYMSLSYDHRVIDGAYGSLFLKSLKNRIAKIKTAGL